MGSGRSFASVFPLALSIEIQAKLDSVKFAMKYTMKFEVLKFEFEIRNKCNLNLGFEIGEIGEI